MNGYELWNELTGDIHGYAILWQLAALVAGLALAWIFNKLILAQVINSVPESWRIDVVGVQRILVPLLALIIVNSSRFALDQWQQHTSLLQLATTLLLALVSIRLTVYALRYAFSPGGWVSATENFIVSMIWAIVVLHLIGLLPILLDFLDGLAFSVGKHHFSVLLLLQSVMMAIVTLVVTLWMSRILENKVMRTEQMDMNLRVVLSKLLRAMLIVVGVLSALSLVGFDVTLLSVFGGALGVGLGFGLQKIASNYVSGFIILLDRSLHLGDVLTVDGHQGVAYQLRARYLVLRKLDGTEVIIPNDTLITSTVINHSLSDRKAQVQVSVRVSYDSPLQAAMKVMLDATQGASRILKNPEPAVIVKALSDCGIDLELTAWVNDPEAGFGSLQSSLYLNILEGFRSQGVTIPFPQRDVHMTGNS
jgi:small-conductance mechanosensitive channel